MKPWFGRFKRAVELHFTVSTVHTSRADACADSALIAFCSSPSFDPAANSVARAFTSCTERWGACWSHIQNWALDLPSFSSSSGYALRLGPVRALQKGSLTRPSHCCQGRFPLFRGSTAASFSFLFRLLVVRDLGLRGRCFSLYTCPLLLPELLPGRLKQRLRNHFAAGGARLFWCRWCWKTWRLGGLSTALGCCTCSKWAVPHTLVELLKALSHRTWLGRGGDGWTGLQGR